MWRRRMRRRLYVNIIRHCMFTTTVVVDERNERRQKVYGTRAVDYRHLGAGYANAELKATSVATSVQHGSSSCKTALYE